MTNGTNNDLPRLESHTWRICLRKIDELGPSPALTKDQILMMTECKRRQVFHPTLGVVGSPPQLFLSQALIQCDSRDRLKKSIRHQILSHPWSGLE